MIGRDFNVGRYESEAKLHQKIQFNEIIVIYHPGFGEPIPN